MGESNLMLDYVKCEKCEKETNIKRYQYDYSLNLMDEYYYCRSCDRRVESQEGSE